MGFARIPYAWQAERHPARRITILTYWSAAQDRARIRLEQWRQQMASRASRWSCVAKQKEGGVNTASHGYFGFMGSPAAFGWPQLGSTWLSASWAEQVVVAEGVLAASGTDAWGVRTRAACWS